MHAEHSCSIRAGCHHAALVRATPYSERFPAQGRIIFFFDRTEERVQVDVQYFSLHLLVF
jgi:hypothetical protein